MKQLKRVILWYGPAMAIFCAVFVGLHGMYAKQRVTTEDGRHQTASYRLAEAPVAASTKAVLVQGKPARIGLPAAGIDVKVVDGVYDPASGSWTLSKDMAHYAIMTSLANNQTGNTFIYGHNKTSVFAALSKIRQGDYADVTTEEGHVFRYVLREYRDVTPQDTGIFQYEGEPILTVQTCSGPWFEKRRLFTFDFVEVRPHDS